MGPNSPQKFSAAKLFGFGGDSKKTPDPKPAPAPEPQHSSFANSFSTQAIKMESNKFDSFKGLPSSSTGDIKKRFDDEPLIAAGHNWNDNNDENDDNDALFNDSDDDALPLEKTDNEGFKDNNTVVSGFNDDF